MTAHAVQIKGSQGTPDPERAAEVVEALLGNIHRSLGIGRLEVLEKQRAR